MFLVGGCFYREVLWYVVNIECGRKEQDVIWKNYGQNDLDGRSKGERLETCLSV